MTPKERTEKYQKETHDIVEQMVYENFVAAEAAYSTLRKRMEEAKIKRDSWLYAKPEDIYWEDDAGRNDVDVLSGERRIRVYLKEK